MNKYAFSLLTVLLSVGVSSVYAQTSAGCERKVQSIERQLEQAKVHGNTHREQGLQRALHNVRTNCTDGSLVKELDEDIAEQKQEILELYEKIAEERAEGDVKKVVKLERELAKEQAELKALEQERSLFSK